VSLALVSGCTGQQAPDSYTDGVQKNFINGCTNTSVADGTLGSASEAKQYCTCAYNAIKKNVKFSTFAGGRRSRADSVSPCAASSP